MIVSGTNGVIDASAKTLTDSLKNYVQDEHRGFFVGVVHTSGSGMVFDATAGTGTKSGAGWTVDEHEGRQLYHNGYIYTILSNTDEELTISDPDETLLDETTTYSIDSFHKILTNTNARFLLQDDNGFLISGSSYSWYVGFIEVVISKSTFKYIQSRFFYQQETWKTGFQLVFEER